MVRYSTQHLMNTLCMHIYCVNNLRITFYIILYTVCILLILIGTILLRRCKVTSPSAGTIKVSCYTYHEILVTLTCKSNCANPKLITYGNSPLTVQGLDRGKTYSVTINVFDGSHVVFSDQTITQNITVMDDSLTGEHFVYSSRYIAMYV